ncbi:MAG: PLDc N-terminal domain-containing protein [Alphaproteobacteria bacterium]|nr:PLDc N-terminal domain-containing protein [Alphaproteobacteria bacterium]
MGLIGAIILALDIYAIYCILHEPWSGLKKVVWVILILIFQVVAMAVYFLFFRSAKP